MRAETTRRRSFDNARIIRSKHFSNCRSFSFLLLIVERVHACVSMFDTNIFLSVRFYLGYSLSLNTVGLMYKNMNLERKSAGFSTGIFSFLRENNCALNKFGVITSKRPVQFMTQFCWRKTVLS